MTDPPGAEVALVQVIAPALLRATVAPAAEPLPPIVLVNLASTTGLGAQLEDALPKLMEAWRESINGVFASICSRVPQTQRRRRTAVPSQKKTKEGRSMSGESRPLVSDASAMVRLLDEILGPVPDGRARMLSPDDISRLHEIRDLLRESVAAAGAGTTVGLAPGRTFRTGGVRGGA
jgi:hypothetical protein